MVDIARINVTRSHLNYILISPRAVGDGACEGDTCLYLEGLYLEALINHFLAAMYLLNTPLVIHITGTRIISRETNMKPENRHFTLFCSSMNCNSYPEEGTS